MVGMASRRTARTLRDKSDSVRYPASRAAFLVLNIVYLDLSMLGKSRHIGGESQVVVTAVGEFPAATT